MKLTWATAAQAPAMASAHAQAFDTPWREDEFEDLLDGEGIFGFVAEDDDPLGVVLCRTAAGEMEILTLGVAPWARRRGVARALLTAALGAARQGRVAEAFLEVAIDNDAGCALYESIGFRRAGFRKAYYDRGAAGRADALVMRLDLSAIAP